MENNKLIKYAKKIVKYCREKNNCANCPFLLEDEKERFYCAIKNPHLWGKIEESEEN